MQVDKSEEYYTTTGGLNSAEVSEYLNEEQLINYEQLCKMQGRSSSTATAL